MSRSQIAQTIQASYFSIPIQSAARLIYFNEDTNQTMKFAEQVCYLESECKVKLMIKNGWAVIPSKNVFVFPKSDNPDIAAYGQDMAGSGNDQLSSKEKGVVKGVPMSTMVGPSLRLAHQLEAIV